MYEIFEKIEFLKYFLSALTLIFSAKTFFLSVLTFLSAPKDLSHIFKIKNLKTLFYCKLFTFTNIIKIVNIF